MWIKKNNTNYMAVIIFLVRIEINRLYNRSMIITIKLFLFFDFKYLLKLIIIYYHE